MASDSAVANDAQPFSNNETADEESVANGEHVFFSLRFLVACVVVGLAVTVVCLVRFLRNLSRYTFLPYLSAILVANVGFLSISFLMALQRMTGALPIPDFWCKSILYAQAVLNNCQLPCIAAIALQLYVTVFAKLGTHLPCTCLKTRSSSGQKFALATFVFLSAAIDAKLVNIFERDESGLCILGAKDEHWLRWISWANSILFCFVPFVITLVTNLAMLVKLVNVERNIETESANQKRRRETVLTQNGTVIEQKRRGSMKRGIREVIRRLRRQRRLATAGVLALLFVIVFLKIPNHLLNLYRVIRAEDFETGVIYDEMSQTTLEVVSLACFVSFHLQFIFTPFYIFTNALLRRQPQRAASE